MRYRFLLFLLLLAPLLWVSCNAPTPPPGPAAASFVTDPCDGRPDGDIFREPSETGHGVDQDLVDLVHGLGHLLLLLWWLFAAGLLGVAVAVLRRSAAVWPVLAVPFLLVAGVAWSPLQALRQQLADLQQFQEKCRYYDPPSRAFLTYKQHRWDDATPYLLMVAGITLLYVPAVLTVIRAQKLDSSKQTSVTLSS
jgi:hypothetical protein